ncbi:MAG: sigma-70 family RNA polymerase sigma factor [Desulfatibacillum sp.]|nr:sigma-70 family RNA polymerase sigma factor [Desulfatibacillum sp.]
MDQEQEKQAILDVKAGDTARFALLVDAYKTPLFNLAYRMTGSRTEAEDLVQDTFVRAFRNLDSFDSTRRFFPWLYTIGLNLVRRRLKTKGLHSSEPASREQEESREPGPEQAFLDKERAGEVQDALLQLKPDQREALILRYVQGLTYDEIAEILDVTPSAAKMRVYRGLDQLRTIIPETIPAKADHEP